VTGSDVLRLEVRHFRDAENWDWALKDAAGQHLAAHSVRIDSASPQYRAMGRLPVHVRWEADPERLLESEAEVLGRVGRWMGEEVFGAVGRAPRRAFARYPALVVVGARCRGSPSLGRSNSPGLAGSPWPART